MDDYEASAGHSTDDGLTVSASQVQPTDATPALPQGVAEVAPSGIRPADAGPEILAESDAPRPRSRGRLVATLVAVGVALVLVVGLGVYVAYRTFFADGRHPERFTPASVAGFVSVDLDASLGQQAKLLKLATKLGKQGGAAANVDPKSGNVLADLLDQLHLTGVDVKRDLTSWLGLRAALSLWLDGQHRPYALIAATTTDDAKATAGLGRVRKTLHDADVGFAVHDGTALIAIGERDAQQAADAAASEATKAPLDALTSFQDARHWLGDEQIVVVWVDLDRYSGAFTAALGGLGGMGGGMSGVGGIDGIGGMVSSTAATAGHGTSITGVSVTDDGLEARYRTFNAQQKAGGLHDAVARLSDMPANTQVGAVLAVPNEPTSTLGSPFSPYSLLLGVPGGGLLFQLPSSIVEEPSVGPTPKVPSEAEMKEIEALLSKNPADLTQAEAKRLRELTGFDPTNPTNLTNPIPTPVDQPGDPVSPFSGAIVGLTITQVAGGPSGRLVAEMASSDAAASLSKKAQASADRYTLSVRDKTVTVVSKDYAPSGGKLAGEAAFQKVMAGAPARTDLAVYADLGSVLTPEQHQRFPARTVALVQGVEGSDEVGLLRVVIG